MGQQKPLMLLLVVAFFYGTSFPAVNLSLRHISPEQLLFMRFGIASLVGVLLFPRSFIKVLRTRKLVLLGIINGVSYLIQFIGQQWTPAGQASVFVSTYALFVPLIGLFLIHEPYSKPFAVGTLIAFVGVLLITLVDSDNLDHSIDLYLSGAVLIIFSAFVWAFYIVLSREIQISDEDGLTRITPEDTYYASVFYTSLTGLVGMSIFSSEVKIIIEFDILLLILYLGLFATLVPFFLYQWVLSKMKAGVTSTVILGQVVVAFIFSVVFLGESPGLSQVVGSLLVVLGILLVLKTNQRQEEERHQPQEV